MAFGSADESGYGTGVSPNRTDHLPTDYVRFDAHAQVDSIIIPDAELLFTGDFRRAGPDLVLTGHDSRRHVIPDYFSSEKHPALVAPNGARLLPDLVDLLAGSPTPGQYAQAQPTAQANPIGRVEKVVGDATVMRNGVSVALHVGDAVYQSDVIQTGGDSSVGISFPDGTALNLVANTRMALNEYVYDPAGSSNNALFSLVEGTFAFVAGNVAHGNHMKIETPVATMGIRGTTGTVEQITITSNATGATYSFSVVPDYGTGATGVYDLINAQGDIIGTISQAGIVYLVSPPGPGQNVTQQPLSPAQLAFQQQLVQGAVEAFINQLNNPSPPAPPTNPQSAPSSSPGSSTPPSQQNLQQLLQENNGNHVGFNGPSGPTNTTTVAYTATVQSSSSSTSPPPPPTTLPTPPTTATWIAQSGGVWTSGSNWSTGTTPTAQQVVEISAAPTATPPFTITINNSESVASLVVGAGVLVDIVSGGTLTVANTISNSGTVAVDSTAGDPVLAINGSVFLLDGGVVEMIGQAASMIVGVAGSGATLVNVNNTIIGSGTIGQGDGHLTLVNGGAGTIEAKPLLPGDSGLLAVDTGNTVSNSGLFDAAAGGTLEFQDNVNNFGSINVESGGTVLVESITITGNAGSTITNAGLFEVAGLATLTSDAVANNGTLHILGGAGLTLQGGSTITNGAATDTITVDGTLTLNDTSSISGGTLNIDASATAFLTGTSAIDGAAITVTGTLEATAGAPTIGPGTLTISGTVESTNGADLTIAEAVNNLGTLAANGGILDVTGAVTGSGSATINGAGTLELGGPDAQTVTYLGTGTLQLDNATPTSFTGSIAGLAIGDVIDLSGVAVSTAVIAGSTLIVTETNGTVLNYQIAAASGSLSGDVFSPQSLLNSQGVFTGTDLVLVAASVGVAPPTLTVQSPFTLNEWSSAALLIGDAAPGETLGDVTISGLPSNVTLTDSNSDTLTINAGSITLTPAELVGLTLNSTSIDSATTVTLTVTAAANLNGNTASTTQNITLDLAPDIVVPLNVDITATTSSAVLLTQSGGTLTNAGTLTVTGASTITGGSEAGGGTTIAQGGASFFDASGESFTLDNYTLQLNGLNHTNGFDGDAINLNNGAQLIIESGATFTAVQGTNLEITSTAGRGEVVNLGTLEANAESTLLFSNTIVGNAGGTIEANGANSLVELSDSTVAGGTLTTSGPGSSGSNINVVAATGANMSVFDGTSSPVTVDGYVGVFQGAQLELKGTLHIDSANGEIDVGGPNAGGTPTAPTNLVIGGMVTIDTDGLNAGASISLDGSATDTVQIVAAGGGGTLENVNTRIEGSGNIGAGNPLFLLVNEASGTINATGTTALIIDNDSPATNNFAPNAIVNAGTMEANGGGELTIENTTIDNSTFNPSSSTGSDGTIEAFSGSSIELDNATILQGFVSIEAGGALDTVAGSINEIETANGPTHNTNVPTISNAGTINIADGSTLALASPYDIENSGTIKLNSTGDQTILYFNQPDPILAGGGNIVLEGGAGSQDIIAGLTGEGFTTVNLDNQGDEISGAGAIGQDDGALTFTNDTGGVIDADLSGQTLTVETGNAVVNKGTLEASNGGDLVVDDQLDTEGGTISIQGGGTVALGIANGLTADFSGSGGTLQLDGAVTGGAAAGIDATSTGGAAAMTITVESTGSVASTSADGIDATSDGGGITITADGAVSGAENGLDATQSGNGGVAISVGSGATIGGSSQYGIAAFSLGAGDVSVSTGSGDTVDSGGAGIVADNQSTTIPAGAGSTVTVTAAGTIDSGTALTDAGNRPAGILAGYYANGQPEADVTGNVSINNYANITASAGDGIRAFDYGNGNVTVIDEAGTTIKTDGQSVVVPAGSPAVATVGYGIQAFSDGIGNVSVTTSAGDTINAAGAGLAAQDDDPLLQAGQSTVTVTAYGMITSGTDLTAGGNTPAGILAGYFPTESGTEAGDTNATGTVIVNNFANITAAAGAGIEAYNWDNGNVTVNDNVGTVANPAVASTTVSGATDGILAEALSGGTGDVTVNVGTNAAISSTALYGIWAFNEGPGNITVAMSAGDTITSGSDGISAVSFGAPTEPTSSAITVTAAGHINSGANLNGDGNPPGGIVAGYYPGNSGTVDPNVTGNVTINTSDATITAAAGFGIEGFTDGTGNVSITTDAETSITVTAASTNGNFSADVGIQAAANDGGNVTINNAATVTAATGTAVAVFDTTPHGDGTGIVTITNTGDVFSGGTTAPFAPAVQIITDDTGSASLSNAFGAIIAPASFFTGGVAISAGDNLTIDNSGTLIGDISVSNPLFANNTTFTNESTGVWDVSGFNGFGSGTDAITNKGTIDIAANGVPLDGQLVNTPTNSHTNFVANGALTFQNEGDGQVTIDGTTLISGDVTITTTGTSTFAPGFLSVTTFAQTGTGVIVGGAVTGDGTFHIPSGGTLEFASTATVTATFDGQVGTLRFDDATPTSFSGQIDGLVVGDTIDLANIGPTSISSAVINGATLTVTETNNTQLTYQIGATGGGSLSGDHFSIQGDGATGTDLVLTAQQNLVVNGGFETGDFSGWTESGNTGYTGVSPENQHSGNYAASLGPVGSDVFLDQYIATASGATYQIEFWLENPGGTPSDFAASFGGATLLSLADTGAQPYTEYTYDVTASSTSTELLFSARQDPSYWYLDDVSVAQISSAPTVNTWNGTGDWINNATTDWSAGSSPNPGDEATIASGQAQINSDLTLDGNSIQNDAAIDVTSGAILTLENGAAIIGSGGSLTINTGSALDIEGGANSQNVTLDGLSVYDNGAINVGQMDDDPTLTLDDGTTIYGNGNGTLTINLGNTLDVEAGNGPNFGATFDDLSVYVSGALDIGTVNSGAILILDDGTSVYGDGGTLTINSGNTLDVEAGNGPNFGATFDDLSVYVSGALDIGDVSSGALLTLDAGTTVYGDGGTLTINAGDTLDVEYGPSGPGATLDGVNVTDNGAIHIDTELSPPTPTTVLFLDDGTTITGGGTGTLTIGPSGELDIEYGSSGPGATLDGVRVTNKNLIDIDAQNSTTLTLDDGTIITDGKIALNVGSLTQGSGTATLIGTTADAQGITGLVVDGVSYNVHFLFEPYVTAYPDANPIFLNNESVAADAAAALENTLNSLGVSGFPGNSPAFEVNIPFSAPNDGGSYEGQELFYNYDVPNAWSDHGSFGYIIQDDSTYGHNDIAVFTLTPIPTGTIDVEQGSNGGATLDNVIVTDGGAIEVGLTSNATLTLDDGTTISGGTLTIGSSDNPGSSELDVEFGSNGPGATLDGVMVTDNGAIDIDLNASGAILTLDDGATINGGGNGALNINSLGELLVDNNLNDLGARIENITAENGGTIAVQDGSTLELNNVTLNNTGSVELNAENIESGSPTYLVIAGTVTLQGGDGSSTGPGLITLTDDSDNAILSNGAAAELINVDNTISGAGTIGDSHLTLDNKQYGVIDADGSNPLVLDTGPNAVINDGLMEATNGGTLQIVGPAGFSDQFTTDAALNPGWTVVSPNSSSSIQLVPGTGLEIDASPAQGGSDLYSGSNYNAPVILQPINPLANWTIETEVNFNPTYNYQGAGILLATQATPFTSDTEFNRIAERAYYPNGGGDIVEGAGGSASYSGTDIYLEVTKVGDVYTTSYSSDGSHWMVLGSETNATPYNEIGLFSIAYPWNGDTSVAPADFTFFDVAPTLTNTGTIAANDGTVTIAGAVDGTGAETISNYGILDFQSAVSAGQTITFADATGTLDLADPADFHAGITGFVGGDVIDLTNIGYLPNEYDVWTQSSTANGGSGTLAIYDGSTLEETLSLSGIYTPNEFKVTSDGASGTPGTALAVNNDFISFNSGHVNENEYASPQISNAGSTITLTNGGQNEAASWFATTKVSIANFTASFDYQANGQADGMAFILQDSSAGASALGSAGGNLGYGNTISTSGVGPTISPSAAVEFNIYNGGHTQGTNFATDGGAGNYNSTLPVDFWDTGDTVQVVLNYNGGTQILTETLTDLVNGNTFTTTYNNDLASTLGSNTAYVGFSAGTGGLASTQTVSNFTLADPTLSISLLQDGGFESPNLGTGNSAYDPSGTPWTFTFSNGSDNGGSGIAGNDSGFTSSNPNAPEGDQVAFLQSRNGSSGQTISETFDATAGTYVIDFDAAQRGNGAVGNPNQSFEVLVDGNVVGTYDPSGTNYTAFSASATLATSGAHTLTFEATNTNQSTDVTALIDDVALLPTSIQAGAVTVANTPLTLGGISVSELEPGDIITASLSVAHGTLLVGSGTGVAEQGVGTDALTLSGTAAAVDAVLAALEYTPNANFVGDDTLSVSAADGAVASTPGALTIDVVMPAADDWSSSSGGDWSAAGNWSTHEVPGTTSEVDITSSSGSVITFDLAEDTIYSLNLSSQHTLDINQGSSLTVTSTVENDNSIVIDGTLDIGGAVTGSGTLHIASGAALELASTSTNTVTFDDSTGTLQIESTGTPTPYSVHGGGNTLPAGDIIDLPNISFDAAADNYNSGTGVITVGNGNAGNTVTIDVAGGISSGNTFTFESDGHGGTEVFDPPASSASPSPVSGSAVHDGGDAPALSGSGGANADDPSVTAATSSTVAASGSLDISGASDQAVTFASGTGSLVLGQAEAFNGEISGFAGTAPDAAHSDIIDLAGFDAADTSVSAITSGGITTLTVTDSSGDRMSASLKLVGTYSTSEFVVRGDGHGGADIFDPPASSDQAKGGTPTVSLGSNDSFVFQPGSGEASANWHPQSSTVEAENFANLQQAHQLTSLITPDAHCEPAIALCHTDTGALPSIGYLQAHLQSFAHLH